MHTEKTRSHWLSTWLAALLCLCLLPCRAESPTEEGRYLFVVDISSGMTKSATQGLRSALELLSSNMQGQFRNGDTLGLWSYNDKLHTDAPMLMWDGSNKARIMETLATHWRAQNYGRKSHLDVLLPSLFSVIKGSSALTIIWINDGSGTLRGTPFDSQINQLHAEYAKELRAANQCFVTVLACRDGEVIDFAVNSTIGPFRVPLARQAPKPVPIVVKTNPPVKPREMKQIVIGPPPKTNVEVKATAPTNVAPPVAATTDATTNISRDPGNTNATVTPAAATPLSNAPEVKPIPRADSSPSTAIAMVAATNPVPVAEARTPVAVAPAVPLPIPTNLPVASATMTNLPATNPPMAAAAATQAVAHPPSPPPPAPVSNPSAATAPQESRSPEQAPANIPPDAQPISRTIIASVLLVVAIIMAAILLRLLRKDRAQPSLISESFKRSNIGTEKLK